MKEAASIGGLSNMSIVVVVFFVLAVTAQVGLEV
jgi:hypothetical protein